MDNKKNIFEVIIYFIIWIFKLPVPDEIYSGKEFRFRNILMILMIPISLVIITFLIIWFFGRYPDIAASLRNIFRNSPLPDLLKIKM